MIYIHIGTSITKKHTLIWHHNINFIVYLAHNFPLCNFYIFLFHFLLYKLNFFHFAKSAQSSIENIQQKLSSSKYFSVSFLLHYLFKNVVNLLGRKSIYIYIDLYYLTFFYFLAMILSGLIVLAHALIESFQPFTSKGQNHQRGL